MHQVPVHMDGDYRQFAAWWPDQLENVIFIAGATVLVKSVSLRDLGVVPGMLLEMRARLTGGAGDSHPTAALAGFRVQKYETWREYLAGWPMTAGALTRAIEKMIGRFAGDLPSLLTSVSVTCPGLEPEHMWTLLGCFETYAGALLDFSVMRYVQVRREEYHDPEDWDALQEARREYDEAEHQVRVALTKGVLSNFALGLYQWLSRAPMGIILQLSAETLTALFAMMQHALGPRRAFVSVYNVPDADEQKEAGNRRMWSDPVKVKHWEERLDADTHIFSRSPNLGTGRPTVRFSPWVGARH